MPTLTGVSGTSTSITLTVSGMSEGTLYKRTYKWILNSVVRKTTTDSKAGATSASAYISGLTPSTPYQCKVEIYNPGGSKVSETEYIRVVTLDPDPQPVTVPIYNYLDGRNTLVNGSFTGDINNTFYISASGTQYQTYSQQYEFQYFTLSTQNYNTAHDASYPIKIKAGLIVRAYYKSISYPYTVYVYIDGSLVRTAQNTTNTESKVRISELAAYTAYADSYDFQYAKVGGSSVEYASYSLINLTQGSMTYISLYFVKKLYPYTIYIYIDGTAGPTTTNTTNTESSVLVSSLFADTQYAIDYDFQYATVVGLSGQYNANSRITLTSGSTTGIRLYFKSKIRSVAPLISNVTTTSTTAAINWSKNGGTEGVWIIYYGLSSASMVSGGYVTSSPATITGLTPGKTYIFYIQNYVSSSDKANSNSVTAATNEAIGYFAWTNDDATNIQSGQPVTNLTASAWQNLIAKVAACGGSTGSIPTASSGTKITANHFNQMRNAISGLTGAGSVASSVTSGTSKVLASLFANATTALKEAINRAISAKNNQ